MVIIPFEKEGVWNLSATPAIKVIYT